MQTLTRRDALRAALGLAALAGAPRFALAQDKKIPLSVQLYSVRDFCGKDFDAALKEIAGMGFQGVEFAGYHKYSNDAQGLRKKLDELGLKAAATHIGANSFVGDALKRTIEFHKTIGCTLLICPGDKRFNDPEKSKEFAEIFTKAAEALKPEGLFCGYHNHAHEFSASPDGKTWWDLFAERTSKDVVLQQDAGWTIAAGKDPAEYAKKYPGRTKTTHIKAKPKKGSGAKPILGQDGYDWKPYIQACYEVGGTEWFSVEQEEYPDGKTSMECVKLSLDGWKKILAEAGR